MTETIRVKAVPGCLMPMHQSRGFVGYVEAQPGERADHEMPGGRRYRIVSEGVDVPSIPYYRRALARGDLADASGSRATKRLKGNVAAPMILTDGKPPPTECTECGGKFEGGNALATPGVNGLFCSDACAQRAIDKARSHGRAPRNALRKSATSEEG